MKIVILGANGMLARSLQSALLENTSHEVFSFARDRVDVSNPEMIKFELDQIQADYVINCTAYTNVDLAESEEGKAFAINDKAVMNLVEYLKDKNIPLVHFSTDYVFAGDKSEGYLEDDSAYSAKTKYGESKLAGELNIKNNLEKYYLVRTSWLYGPHGKNFVKTMLDLSETKDKLKVVDDQIGRPTAVEDLVGMLIALMEGDYAWGTYHGVNESSDERLGVSWYDFAKKIFELSNKDIKLDTMTTEELNRAATRPAYSILLNTKFPKLRSWEEALEEYLNKYHS